MSKSIDGCQNLLQGDIASFRKDANQGLTFLGFRFGCTNMERAIFAEVHVRISPSFNTTVRLMVLVVYPCRESAQSRLPIRKFCQVTSFSLRTDD